MKRKSPRTIASLRLFKLYVGVLAFAVLAAWGTSVSLGFHHASVTPGAVLIRAAKTLPATVPSKHSPTTPSATGTSPVTVTGAKSSPTSPVVGVPTTTTPPSSTAATVPSGSIVSQFVPVNENVDVITLPTNGSSSTDSTTSDSSTTTTTTLSNN